MSLWTGYDCNCGSANWQATQAWKAQSVVQDGPGANYRYLNTRLMSAFCTLPIANNAHPQGQYFADKIKAVNVSAYDMFLMDGCSGSETTWDGTYTIPGESVSGLNKIVSWAAANCIPLHNP